MYVHSSVQEVTYIHDLLVAVEAVSVTCTVILTDDGLLSTSTGCTCLLLSLTVYVDRLNLTPTKQNTMYCLNTTNLFQSLCVCMYATYIYLQYK